MTWGSDDEGTAFIGSPERVEEKWAFDDTGMIAAPQQMTVGQGTIAVFRQRCPAVKRSPPMSVVPPPREVFIQGVTLDGRTFRPSDWAERLAGAMSCFRPGGVRAGIGAHIGYSPFCVPTVINGVKCVIVNEELKTLEPMAWDFVMNFARDNKLQVADACLLPDSKPGA
jgi:hypothetical protein